MHPRPKLTPEETAFLRAWIWEEAHPHVVENGAKRLQIERNPHASPILADIATATMTADEQVDVANGPKPSDVPAWPWSSDQELRARHEEAMVWLETTRLSRKHVPIES